MTGFRPTATWQYVHYMTALGFDAGEAMRIYWSLKDECDDPARHPALQEEIKAAAARCYCPIPIREAVPAQMADVGDFTTNPHATIARFGIVKFHYAVWLIAHGALDDIDPPGKKNRRVYRSPSPHASDVVGPIPAGYPGRRPTLRHGPTLRG